jgi:DNA repair exonuclease SbcCD ATPase subunit
MVKEEQKEPDAIGQMAEQIGIADKELQALQVERENLPKLIEQAAHDADAPALVSARRRLDEIGDYIHAAEVRLTRLRLNLIKVRLEEAKLEKVRAAEAVAPVKARFEVVRGELQAVEGAFSNANYTYEDLLRSEGEVGRYLENLMLPTLRPRRAA